MRFVLSLILLASAPAAAAPDWSEAVTAKCSYFNTKTDELIEGRCTERWGSDGDHLVAEYVMGKKRFSFIQVESQGQFGTYTWSGKAAVRYEVNREEYHFATLDLTEFLDVTY